MKFKIPATILVLLLVSATAFAEDAMSPEVDRYMRTIREFTAENEDTPAGEITLGEIRAVIARLSVIRQQIAHVRKSAAISFFMPGAGHIMNGRTGSGVLFAAGGVLISGGTLVGAYFVLPESVQFGNVNYFTDSFAAIEAEWKALSFTDLLPSLGIITAGTIVDMFYRGFVSKKAASVARTAIRNGEKEFEPEFGLFLGGAGKPMMGMRHRF